MKKLNRIAAAAMMLLVAVTSNAQVVQNEEQIYGRWRIVMTEEISLLLSLEEGGNGSVALSMSEDETDGVILVVMDGKWGFNNDTISINPDVQTVRLQYFGADETMKQMISAIPEEQRQELASALAEEAIEKATFKFLRAKDAHHTKYKGIHFLRTSSLELSFDRRPPCQIDGEAHIADSYSISTKPAALRVLTVL